MSTHKHIDALCAVITVLTVLLAVLFMNGAALGIEPLEDGDGGQGQFTANDLDGDWDASEATKIMLTSDGADIVGLGAYAVDGDVHIVYGGRYVLTGSLSDGSVIVEADGDDKVWLLLDGAEVHCSDSAALLVEQAEKVFLTLAADSENVLSSGLAYSEAAVAANVDGAVYARDDLTVNGTGALTVTGEYQHGVVCNDDLVLAGGTLTVTAAQDALHANDSCRIAEAAVTLTAGDDGVTVSNDAGTGYFYMQSGSLTIPSCYEGVEAVTVTIDGGTVDIAPTDDGINATGTGETSPVVRISGGDVRIVNDQGMDADGIDSNGDIYIDGGRVLISVTGTGGNAAIDYGSEYGGVCQVNGGTLIACGGSMMVESLDQASGQGFVECAVSGGAGAALTLTDESGNTLLDETVPCAFTYVMLSAPGMTAGSAYTVAADGTATQATANSVTAASGGFGPMGGGRMMGGGGRMGGMFLGGGLGETETGQQPDQTMGQTMGQPPEMPTGQEQMQGQMPAMPDGQTEGQLPELPAGQEQGQVPATPEGQTTDQVPSLPEGQEQDQMPATPEGQTEGQMPVVQEGQEQMQLPDMLGRRQMQGQVPAAETAVSAEAEQSLPAGTWILLALSAAVLLAGILIAAKVKH